MIVDHPLITRKVFFPEPNDVEVDLAVEADGATLGCLRSHAHDGAGTLLHFHGNGETAAEHVNLFRDSFLAMGVNVCFAEYRGYGTSTGEPALGAMLPDGERIAAELGDPSRLVVYGRSLGSVYALELARRIPDLAGLVIESGLSDVGAWLRGKLERNGGLTALGCTEEEFEAEVAGQFDFESTLRNFRGGVLVMHAENDHLLPAAHAERLHEWAADPGKKLALFPRGDHNTFLLQNTEDYLAELGDFLRRVGVTAEG